MFWLFIKYVKTLFRRNDLNIFKITGSKVIGLKFSDKLGSPFLWVAWWHIKMVAALAHCACKVLPLSTSAQIFKINDLKYGRRLK